MNYDGNLFTRIHPTLVRQIEIQTVLLKMLLTLLLHNLKTQTGWKLVKSQTIRAGVC